jgi:hypothetical protein
VASERRGAALALASASLLAFAATGAAFAQVAAFKLILAPVGQAGPYFDLALAPGQTVHLDVALGNDGTAGVAALTYATDVFTITNGGYGGRLRDAPQTGATTWLTYPTAVLDLPPGRHVTRALTVSVPADATPGEYISSLVVENDTSVHTDGAIGFDQVVRQAIAVAITVPGARLPELGLGEAHHEIVAGRSVVTVAVHNTGNVRLRPMVAFRLRDASGTEISRSAFQMDTFFARTDTLVSVSLATLLPPGSYTIDLTLTDATQDVSATGAIPLTVGAPTPSGPGGGEGLGLIQVGPGGGSGSLAIAAVGLASLLAVLGLGAILRRRHQRRLRPATI